MARGGKRPGTGRPKGAKNQKTVDNEAELELVRRLVAADLTPMVLAQIAHAKGSKFLVARDPKTGKFMPVTDASQIANAIEVWAHPPSTQAFADLMNRAFGKPVEPPQAMALTGQLVIGWRDTREPEQP
jgi:hypothetical protein